MLSELISNLRGRLLSTSTLSQETTRDGQTLFNNFFQSTVVDDTAAFVLANDLSRLLNFGEITTNNAPAAVEAQGQDVDIFNFGTGVIDANNGPDVDTATGVQVTGSADIRNFGNISGEFNAVEFLGALSSGRLDNFAGGQISSDSRVVDIQGSGVVVRNFGDILGTGDQREGTVFVSQSAEDFSINNLSGGTIDAGEGNDGAGIILEIGDEEEDVVSGDIFNGFNSTIQGRNEDGLGGTLAGDGIRIRNGEDGAVFDGDIFNAGNILSEADRGGAAAIRVENGQAFEGQILNTSTGVIDGARNGINIGDAEHDLDIRNFGTISAGSRAVNIDGTGVDLVNGGDILGTGNQRNGTVFSEGSADDFSVNNLVNGTIDAGDGNRGSGISIDVGDADDGATSFDLDNAGTIQGRGDASSGSLRAGDGVRISNGGEPGTTDGTITNSGQILSEGPSGTTAGVRFVDGVNFQGTLDNSGLIDGVQNGVYVGEGDHTGGVVNNLDDGVISSGSRAFNIDGTGLEVNNAGEILGTGNQRNGTVYADGTADDFTVNNLENGVIDAGEGNQGSGFGVEIGGTEDGTSSFTLDNDGVIAGRGNASAASNLAGDGVRVGNVGNIGVTDAQIDNSGTISSEGANGTVAGVRFVNGVSFQGEFNNSGEISGVQNGVYFGNAVNGEGADHTGGVFNNLEGGSITSDSRAFNIDGTGLVVNNAGEILGTGNQRNGTVYADGTADDFTVNNLEGGVIDAGEGNQGSGLGVEIGGTEDGTSSFTLDNDGTIQGRGNASAASNLAGDGVRVGNVGNVGVTDAQIDNSGTISSEGANGTVAGVRFVNGVSFQGEFNNSGEISGVQNGVYFGNAVNGEGADHTGGVFNNLEGGSITSDSRAFNIDGTGLVVNNAGDILGTGDQRNGTVYADGTADDFTVNNLESGVIDAGEGNQGSGFAAEIDGDLSFDLDNDGTIQGRGNGDAATGLAGDGIRVGNVGNSGTFTGTITNSGTVSSEGANGTVGGFRSVNNVNFQGELTNEEGGTIDGVANGVYFGTGDHTGGSFVNRGTVSSDSRAVNIDGEGLQVVNEGDILGTGDQRNGTVYADGTADLYSFENSGTVDAGEGNNGSAVSLQTGDTADDIVSAFVSNEDGGVLQGRGDATEGNQVGDGLRLFTNQENASFAGVVVNEGLIAGSESSDAAAGIRVDGGLNLLGAILNEGEIRGTVNAIDASDAGTVSIVNDEDGVINGNVLLGDGNDVFTDFGTTNGDIFAGAGDDVIIAGASDDVVTGGLGDDFIDGGEGFDTADFSDLDVAITVDLDENGNGTVTRDTGFTISTGPTVIPTGAGASVQDTNVVDGASFVSEALAGNLYFNVHTSDVIGGEIRGQLDTVQSDEVVEGIRTIVITGDLDSDQEVGTGSTSEATGTGTLVITVDEETGEVSYTSDLTVVGLNEADLQTPAPGVASAIHLHNAPEGENGAIVRDTLVDAGAVVDGSIPAGAGGADVFENQVETDTLTSIERVVGSDDTDTVDLSAFDGVRIDLDVNTPQPGPASQEGVVQVDGETVLEVVDFENVLGSSGDDLILGNNEINVLEGLGGNDSIHSFGGEDTIDGGEGTDTALFSAGAGVVVDLDEDGNAIATINADDGAVLDTVLNFENINGSNNAGSPNGGNDILSGNSSANVINGQAGDDILNGEGGNDVLIGGAGSDTFTFEGIFDDDVIQDFEVGVDNLDFGDDFDGELDVVDQDGDALISFGDQGSVLLVGVSSDELVQEDLA